MIGREGRREGGREEEEGNIVSKHDARTRALPRLGESINGLLQHAVAVFLLRCRDPPRPNLTKNLNTYYKEMRSVEDRFAAVEVDLVEQNLPQIGVFQTH